VSAIVRVELGARSYEACVAPGAIEQLDAQVRAAGVRDFSAVALVADAAVAPVALVAERALARLGVPVHPIVLDVSEQSKSPEGLGAVYERFASAGLDRASLVVALGGGVTGDLAGYAAATYLRGIRWLPVPTTLLAAVDAAIGGKTGINLPRGKNLIGAFHQPVRVVVDPFVLASLPQRERISGFGEMLKYGLSLDPALWERLSAGGSEALDPGAIARCIALKAGIVSQDEFETGGVREVLNFGHTVGHAIEAVTGYAHYRHGEAVVLGMRAAVRISALRGLLDPTVADDIDAGLARVPLPAPMPFDLEGIVAATTHDKKRRGGATRFVLLTAIGATVLDAGVDRATIRAALEFLPQASAA
jgi:3-dehydroquinate synthase